MARVQLPPQVSCRFVKNCASNSINAKITLPLDAASAIMEIWTLRKSTNFDFVEQQTVDIRRTASPLPTLNVRMGNIEPTSWSQRNRRTWRPTLWTNRPMGRLHAWSLNPSLDWAEMNTVSAYRTIVLDTWKNFRAPCVRGLFAGCLKNGTKTSITKFNWRFAKLDWPRLSTRPVKIP